MNSIDHACVLFKLARSDLKALTGMVNPELFTDAIFGFHTQQAVEKGLKSWLVTLDVLFPTTHDISRLLLLLADNGVDVANLWEWVIFTPFAVEHRYTWPESEDEPLDRALIIAQVTDLLEYIQSRMLHGDW
ncbi:MAG: HEPN domain-containing protein [Magnetococcales bacterium]|nr:HEPN domain-containing protein [Magnetococcales bacterium]